jgi:ubiquitin-protein ligase
MTQPSLNKVILKEFQDTCFRSFAQNQIKIEFPDEEDLTKVLVVLTPNDGLYEGARIVFSVDLTENYPTRFPTPLQTCVWRFSCLLTGLLLAALRSFGARP